MGFFADDGGVATIQPLSNENVSQAVMAGVISRSAYVEAHAPSESDKGSCFYRDLKIPRFRVRERVGLPVPVHGYTGNQSNLRYTG